jgi:hypothetical protein
VRTRPASWTLVDDQTSPHSGAATRTSCGPGIPSHQSRPLYASPPPGSARHRRGAHPAGSLTHGRRLDAVLGASSSPPGCVAADPTGTVGLAAHAGRAGLLVTGSGLAPGRPGAGVQSGNAREDPLEFDLARPRTHALSATAIICDTEPHRVRPRSYQRRCRESAQRAVPAERKSSGSRSVRGGRPHPPSQRTPTRCRPYRSTARPSALHAGHPLPGCPPPSGSPRHAGAHLHRPHDPGAVHPSAETGTRGTRVVTCSSRRMTALTRPANGAR